MIKALLNEKQFLVLLAGSLLSRIGDGLHEFVFIITALNVTNNSIAKAGAIYFFRFIPYLIFGPIGGVLSDKLPRKILMLTADLMRMIITASFCIMLINGSLGASSLAFIGMLMTTFRTIFQPAFQASVPSLVKPNNLPQINGYTQIANEIGGMVGPALAGTVLAFGLNLGQILALDVVTYIISIICILCISLQINYPIEKQKLNLQNLYGDFLDNLMSVMAKPQLFITILYSAICILFVGSALRILIPAIFKQVGFSESVLGYAMSLIALGAIVGSIICSRFIRKFSTRKLMFYWSFYGIALSLLPLGLMSTSLILTLCGVLGLAGAFVDVALITNIQNLSTNQNMGKNFALFSTLANIGEAMSGWVVGIITLFSSLLISVTLVGLLITAIGYFGQARSLVQDE